MNFIVSSNSLLEKLRAVGGVLKANNTLPILDNFLFTIAGNELTISGSDLETTMTTSLEVESKEEGSIAVPARILMDTLKTFPEQPLTFSVDTNSYGIEIASDQGRYKLTGQNPDEFPKLPELENPTSLKLPAKVLGRAISKTIFATGSDELRPVMSGVYCEFSPDSINFVATDAHKLVKYTRSDVTADQENAFILPNKPLNLLRSQLGSSSDEELSIEYNESNAFFHFGENKLVCRLIEGKYPNYHAVIPDENPNQLNINREQLLSSIKRVSIFSNKTTHQVKLKVTGSELSISAEDLDFANEANERLTCSYEGEDMEIGFNAKFLIEMLDHLEGEEVTLKMSAPNRAGIIVPNEKEEAEDVLMLVMPVMLNS
ncbi:MAG: DNA polymerase III subunit beta [Flavobacteriales bacterium]